MKFPFLFLFLSLLISCTQIEESTTPKTSTPATESLKKHSEEFDKPEVIEVTEGIHVAIGFGLANSILIEGENGNIIVDCMESNEAAKRVKAEFEKINNKPTKAIIYTHNHADHIFGAGVFAGDDKPEVYSHELTNYYIDRIVNVVQPIISQRSYRMFGSKLSEEDHINCGIGLRLDADDNTTRSLVRPTVTFRDQLEVEIEGVKIQMAHVPGETNDQLYVWLPERQVLLPGDNVYKAFPNLYTIRGTPYRDVKQWSHSLDKMRYLRPQFLIPSHTRPVKGEEVIEKILTDYADAIRFVHDQTIRLMNKGLKPNEIAEQVQLPKHLAESPYLQEFYGRVDWSVKSIFSGYLGWFDGEAATLFPITEKDKAEKMIALAGGKDEMLQKIEDAFQQEEYQWVLELSNYILEIHPDNATAKNLRYESLIQFGEKQLNPNARNYLLSQAAEVKGKNTNLIVKRTKALVNSIPVKAMFDALTVNTDPEKSKDYNKKAVFNFSDSDTQWTVHVRNGVTEIQPYAFENPDIKIETTTTIWKEILSKLRNPKIEIAKGNLKIEGGMMNFGEFMGIFSNE